MRRFGYRLAIMVAALTWAGCGAESFNPDQQPVVTDKLTGLMWTGCPVQEYLGCAFPGESLTTFEYPQALSRCSGLYWAEHQDWRLPDIKELGSIVDDRVEDPAIDGLSFPDTPSAAFWSATSDVTLPNQAWQVDFSDGRILPADQATPSLVRCLRNWP